MERGMTLACAAPTTIYGFCLVAVEGYRVLPLIQLPSFFLAGQEPVAGPRSSGGTSRQQTSGTKTQDPRGQVGADPNKSKEDAAPQRQGNLATGKERTEKGPATCSKQLRVAMPHKRRPTPPRRGRVRHESTS
ncbi:hypothetical protein NDU88_001604 [Pleurodeles waltl]|uniref:Uncharacterized protein n=1 Tax=Pleurodeles waltl TaxID=8319 RepID=A0AAV7M056_PLEWA|nr:hypothetical protein NDU88_001604 [Pleurodeles waltl]